MSALKGRTAIVTGGVTKVGQGVVTALRDAGATVVVADIAPDGGMVTKELGEGIHYSHTDITDDAAVTELRSFCGDDYASSHFVWNRAMAWR